MDLNIEIDMFMNRKFLPWQKPVSAVAKPLGSVPPLLKRVFSAQDGARH
jgi:hypothetical protein